MLGQEQLKQTPHIDNKLQTAAGLSLFVCMRLNSYMNECIRCTHFTYAPVKIYFHRCAFHLSVNELNGVLVSGATQRMEAHAYLEDHVIDPNFPAITAAMWINSH